MKWQPDSLDAGYTRPCAVHCPVHGVLSDGYIVYQDSVVVEVPLVISVFHCSQVLCTGHASLVGTPVMTIMLADDTGTDCQVIFFGGCTRAEISAVRALGAKTRQKFMIFTTCITDGNEMIHNFSMNFVS